MQAKKAIPEFLRWTPHWKQTCN